MGDEVTIDFILGLRGLKKDDESNIVKKPVCTLVGEDGNIFNLVGIASKTLKRAGLHAQAKEMCDKVWEAESYDDALSIIQDYVEVR